MILCCAVSMDWLQSKYPIRTPPLPELSGVWTYYRHMNNAATITLSGKTYQITKQSEQGMNLRGKRGAIYAFVRNVNNPKAWALVDNSMKPRAQWYIQHDDGSFEAAS